jgi:tRNA1(Val) A37 N6-methylase TrmN6
MLILMASLKKPKKILEFGTSVGCSGITLLKTSPEAELHTIERYEKSFFEAKENFKTFPKFCRPQIYDYAYAITCHKSQGSEYNKVLVFEEYLKGGDHARWLYTAATRAKEKLVIVRNFR